MYQYRATIDRVVDGDTFDLVVDVGFYMSLTTRVRLRGVDTPEVKGPERQDGLRASAYVMERLTPGKVVLIRSYKKGRFGRFIADVSYVPGVEDPTEEQFLSHGIDLAQELLAAGMAVPLVGKDAMQP